MIVDSKFILPTCLILVVTKLILIITNEEIINAQVASTKVKAPFFIFQPDKGIDHYYKQPPFGPLLLRLNHHGLK